jgi:hypothetical protein
MRVTADWHLTQIHPQEPLRSGEILRCSGCGWTAALLGPEIAFLNFSTALHRGQVIDAAGAGGVLERLDDLRLCGRCLADAALLVSPTPAKTYRDQVDVEQKRLALELTVVTRGTTDAVSSIKRLERRIAELEAERERLAELRAAVAEWAPDWDLTAEAVREARLCSWAWERAAVSGDEQAAVELVDERKRLDSATGKLAALRNAGVKLRDRCREDGLADEAAVINERLVSLQEDENV